MNRLSVAPNEKVIFKDTWTVTSHQLIELPRNLKNLIKMGLSAFLFYELLLNTNLQTLPKNCESKLLPHVKYVTNVLPMTVNILFSLFSLNIVLNPLSSNIVGLWVGFKKLTVIGSLKGQRSGSTFLNET